MRHLTRYTKPRSFAAALIGCALVLGLAGSAAAFGDQLITFDDRPRPNSVLVGEYPRDVANWGLNSWWHAAPTGKFTDRSVSFNGNKASSATEAWISLIGMYRLEKLDIYNAGTQATTVTLVCDSLVAQPAASVVVGPNQLMPNFMTGWQHPCANVQARSTNGWATNFDNLQLLMVFPEPGNEQQLVTFNERLGQNRVLNGEEPEGIISWGTNRWYHAGPTGAFTTKSVSLNGPGSMTGDLTFVGGPRRLVSLQAHNVGSAGAQLTFRCLNGDPDERSYSLAAGALRTIEMGWSGPCTGVRITSSNGWDSNFDNLTVETSLP
jgi:hypothetical protein